jgi:hypothetical protein
MWLLREASGSSLPSTRNKRGQEPERLRKGDGGRNLRGEEVRTVEDDPYAAHLDRRWRHPRAGCGRGRGRAFRLRVVRHGTRDGDGAAAAIADAVSVPAESRAAPLPRCTSEQIAASIDVLGGSATVAVRHARGRACHLASLPVHLRVWDRAGEPLRLPTTEGAEIPSRVGGDFSRGFERLINITYFPPWNCDERGPFLAVVKVGPYVARRPLSRDEIGCFTGG